MSNSKTTLLKDKNGNHVGYRVRVKDGSFDIPVLDSRNPKHIERIAKTTKEVNANRGSKFMKPSYSGWGFSYNVSRKK